LKERESPALGERAGLFLAQASVDAEKVVALVILSEATNLSVWWTYMEERFFGRRGDLRMTKGLFSEPVQLNLIASTLTG
jgi:hypothetical protein